jgi:hypothetical protein
LFCFFSSSNTLNLSPAVAADQATDTGVEGPATLTMLPLSSYMALILP